MKNAASKASRLNLGLPALIAMGGSFAALPAHALQLGDLTVQSKLGQPLRASIAFALSPNEQISSSCISLRQGRTASGLPNIGSATLSVANGSIQLTGRTPVREPIMAAYVVVNCPYTANLSREYMLFVDPMTPTYEPATVTQQVAPQTKPVAVAPAASVVTPAASRNLSSERSSRPASVASPRPINSTTHEVQPGEDLGSIVARIKDRSMKLWPAANAIFDANPHAFIDNNPNKLKAGSVLTIPSLDGTPVVVEPVATSAPASVTSTPNVEQASVEQAGVAEADPVSSAVEALPADNAMLETTADLQPSVDPDFDNPFVIPEGQESVTISDTTLEGPVTTSNSPNVPTASINTVNTSSSEPASNWWLWLAGGGIGLILALLLFARRFRGSVDSTPLSAVVATPQRRASDTGIEPVAVVDVDFDLSDDSPTTENLALDADLVIGTGLDQGTEIEVKETFAFAGGQDVDIELPFEPVAAAEDDTDMMESLRTDEVDILDLATSAEEDDYDMSVIVDATKMPQPEDVTNIDLKAVEVDSTDVDESTDAYTVNNEVDYQILEQDYEDELTATQALNQEIAKAAAALAAGMDIDSDNDETAALPLASVTELDVTAQMPARNDDKSDLDATASNEVVTEKIHREEETVEMPVKSGKRG